VSIIIIVSQQRLVPGSVSAHVKSQCAFCNLGPRYKWWSTRAVLKAHHWFRAIQDPRNQTLTSLCLQSSSKKDNRCFVCFFNRFGSFAFIKAGLWTHRFAAYPRPEKLASSRSSYLEFAQFGSLAHPQSYRSRSAYLECTHLSTSKGLAVHTSNALILAHASLNTSYLVRFPAVQDIARGREVPKER